MIIFADTQAHNQAENSITEAHSNPLWSVDSRGAGQLSDNDALFIFILQF